MYRVKRISKVQISGARLNSLYNNYLIDYHFNCFTDHQSLILRSKISPR